MTGFLLVGGQGRRIGGHKPLRPFRGQPLASIAWDLLAPCSRRIALGRGELPSHIGPQWWEEPAGQGPLVALAWALERSDSEWNAVLAVDYPQLPADLWEQLQQQRAPEALAALPRLNGRMHPLCGLYHRDLAVTLRTAVERGERSLCRALSVLGESVWLEGPWDEECFLNVNQAALLSPACSNDSGPRPESPPG